VKRIIAACAAVWLYVTRPRSLTWRQASSWILGWRYLQDGVAKDLSTASVVVWRYAPTNNAWSVSVTGSVQLATNGQVQVNVNADDINTNGVYNYDLFVSDSSNELAYSYGTLTLLSRPGLGAGALPPFGTNVNWADVAMYQNTAADGPVRAGSNATTTVNADGSINLNVTVDPTFTNGFASVAYVTNYVDSATGGLVTASVTNGLAGVAYVDAATGAVDLAHVLAVGNTAAANIAVTGTLYSTSIGVGSNAPTAGARIHYDTSSTFLDVLNLGSKIGESVMSVKTDGDVTYAGAMNNPATTLSYTGTSVTWNQTAANGANVAHVVLTNDAVIKIVSYRSGWSGILRAVGTNGTAYTPTFSNAINLANLPTAAATNIYTFQSFGTGANDLFVTGQ